MDRIIRTVLEILRGELPKDAYDVPCVLDSPIEGWFFGDRQLISNNELPAIVVDGSNFDMNWATFHSYERTWNFSIMCYARADDSDFSNTLINEMTRLVVQTIRKHSKIWVFEPCMFDLYDFHSPMHLMSHTTELSSLASTAKKAWEDKWTLTHKPQGSDAIPSAPALGDEEAYVTAYLQYYNSTQALSNQETFSYYDAKDKIHYTTTSDVYTQYNRDAVNPVRLLSFVKIEDVQYGFVSKRNSQLLRGSEVKISAKEIDQIHEFGPNNVSDPSYW